ncbi:MAG: hypothetical protein ABJE66_09695 [Deltaproteobacteria bacterium]
MVRAALWAVIACGVAPACSNKSDAPAAQPGALAGKVLEVAGSVKVGANQLAVGDRVNTDDVIETGADGNVVIELAHNLARWELGPGHKVRPTESLAWTQERHGSAAQVDQDTSAAGRPAERSAADTSTSAKTGAPPPAPPAESAAAPAPAAAAPPRSRAAVAAPEIEPAANAPAPGGSIAAAGDVAGSGNLTADTFAKLSTCVPAGGHVQVKIHVANHVPAITFAGDVDAAVKKCMTDAAKKLSIAVASGDLALTLRR